MTLNVFGFSYSIPLLYLIFAVGLVVRLIVAPLFDSGDLQNYRGAMILTSYYGLDTRNFFSVYGPTWYSLISGFYLGYLTVLPVNSLALELVVLKAPSLISDVLIAFLLYRLGRIIADERKATLAAAVWLLNPYTVWMSSMWGILHVVPAFFSLLAFERLVYRRIASSAVTLAIAAGASIQSVFLFPIFVLSCARIHRKSLLRFVSLFFLSFSVLILFWSFSFYSYKDTFTEAGRVSVPTLSYQYFVQLPSQPVIMIVGLIVMFVYFLAIQKSFDPLRTNRQILLIFLWLFLSSYIVWPTYLLWVLPFLYIASIFLSDIHPIAVIGLMGMAWLWTLFWSPIGFVWFTGTGTWPQGLNNELLRDVAGAIFSGLSAFVFCKIVYTDRAYKALKGTNPEQ